MRWLIIFIISWVIFIYLADWKKLKVNIWCGLWSVAIELVVDAHAQMLDFYKIIGPLKIGNTTALFSFGPVFVIGTLLAQFCPGKRVFRVLNVVVLGAVYSLMELMLLASGNVVYMNWSFYSSLTVNAGAMISIGWFSIVALQKGEKAE